MDLEKLKTPDLYCVHKRITAGVVTFLPKHLSIVIVHSMSSEGDSFNHFDKVSSTFGPERENKQNWDDCLSPWRLEEVRGGKRRKRVTNPPWEPRLGRVEDGKTKMERGMKTGQ